MSSNIERLIGTLPRQEDTTRDAVLSPFTAVSFASQRVDGQRRILLPPGLTKPGEEVYTLGILATYSALREVLPILVGIRIVRPDCLAENESYLAQMMKTNKVDEKRRIILPPHLVKTAGIEPPEEIAMFTLGVGQVALFPLRIFQDFARPTSDTEKRPSAERPNISPQSPHPPVDL